MGSLRDFWAIVVEVWEKGLYGIDIGRIVVAVLIFFAFLLMRPLFSGIVVNRVRSYTQKTETPLDDEVLGVVEKPLGFIPIFQTDPILTGILPLEVFLDHFLDGRLNLLDDLLMLLLVQNEGGIVFAGVLTAEGRGLEQVRERNSDILHFNS